MGKHVCGNNKNIDRNLENIRLWCVYHPLENIRLWCVYHPLGNIRLWCVYHPLENIRLLRVYHPLSLGSAAAHIKPVVRSQR